MHYCKLATYIGTLNFSCLMTSLELTAVISILSFKLLIPIRWSKIIFGLFLTSRKFFYLGHNFKRQKMYVWKCEKITTGTPSINIYLLPTLKDKIYIMLKGIQMVYIFRFQMDVFAHFKFCHSRRNQLWEKCVSWQLHKPETWPTGSLGFRL